MQIKIDDFDDLGNGLGKIDNKVCFVNKGLPNEVLDIEITKNTKSYINAKINEIIVPSKERLKPICPFYDVCGGCNFLHATKELENEFKIQKGKKFLGSINKLYETIEFNYRNKVIFHVKKGEIGFYKINTNQLIKITYCYLLDDEINKILELFNKYVDNNFTGEILIRVNSLKETLVSITGNYQYTNILINSNLINNLVYNSKVLKGNNYFLEYINNYKFKVSYLSFFQVNHQGLENIINILSDFLKDKNINIALDLYSGTSVLGIIMARYVQKVISVEEVKVATLDALENKKLNKFNNLEVINGKVEDFIDTFKNIDLVVVDPARRGLDKKTINYLKIIKSNYLIYIACKMDSLKRDLKDLKEIYDVTSINLVDMFPRTNHVESVCVLKLR